MHDSPWILRSTPRPPADREVALVTDPADGAAILFGDAVWRWQGERWALVRADLLTGERAYGSPVAWTEPDVGVVLARLGEEALVRASLREPDAPTVVYVHGLRPHMGHPFAFGDPGGGAWLVAGDSGDNRSITWRMQGDVAVEVARGPYLVRAAFDPQQRALFGLDVSHRGHRLVDGQWRADPRFDGKLDAIVHDPRRGACVGLAVRSDARMELVVLGPAGWQPATPPTWLPTYRNQMRLVIDLRARQLLAFGGQDFDKGGALSSATWFGDAGELRETADPAMPRSWGRYNTLLTAHEGLLAFDHSGLRLHRRGDDGWVQLGEIEPGEPLDLDDRFLNVVWTGDRVALLESRGALVVWSPDTPLRTLAPPSPARQPGPAYSHRTGLGWDPLGARPVVASGDCGRATHVVERGEWRCLDAPGFAAGETVVMATTPAGLYALGRTALRRLTGDVWTTVGASVPGARWLGYEPRRDALLAASAEGLWLSVGTGWRRLAPLPEPLPLGESRGQLGIDPARDELVLIDEQRLWSAALASLDWTDAALPTDASKPRAASTRKTASKRAR